VVAVVVSQYLFDAVASLPSVARLVGCACRTVGRWLHSVATCVQPSALVRALVSVLNAPVVPSVLPVLSMERKARSLAKQTLLNQAAEALACLEAWAQGHGLEPPGLMAWSQAQSVPPQHKGKPDAPVPEDA
jgi:hypothetical protein